MSTLFTLSINRFLACDPSTDCRKPVSCDPVFPTAYAYPGYGNGGFGPFGGFDWFGNYGGRNGDSGNSDGSNSASNVGGAPTVPGGYTTLTVDVILEFLN